MPFKAHRSCSMQLKLAQRTTTNVATLLASQQIKIWGGLSQWVEFGTEVQAQKDLCLRVKHVACRVRNWSETYGYECKWYRYFPTGQPAEGLQYPVWNVPYPKIYYPYRICIQILRFGYTWFRYSVISYLISVTANPRVTVAILIRIHRYLIVFDLFVPVLMAIVERKV